jgi:hypothetical protein
MAFEVAVLFVTGPWSRIFVTSRESITFLRNSHILWMLDALYRAREILPLDVILSQMNGIYSLAL